MTIPSLVAGSAITKSEKNGNPTEVIPYTATAGGSGRLLVVVPVFEHNSNSVAIDSVTFNGLGLVHISEEPSLIQPFHSDGQHAVDFWFLPDVGDGTVDEVTINFSVDVADWAVMIFVLQDAPQSAFISAADPISSTDTTDTAGVDETHSLTTTGTDSLILSVAVMDGTVTNTGGDPDPYVGAAAADTLIAQVSAGDDRTARGFGTAIVSQDAATAQAYTTGFNADPVEAKLWSLLSIELVTGGPVSVVAEGTLTDGAFVTDGDTGIAGTYNNFGGTPNSLILHSDDGTTELTNDLSSSLSAASGAFTFDMQDLTSNILTGTNVAGMCAASDSLNNIECWLILSDGTDSARIDIDYSLPSGWAQSVTTSADISTGMHLANGFTAAVPDGTPFYYRTAQISGVQADTGFDTDVADGAIITAGFIDLAGDKLVSNRITINSATVTVAPVLTSATVNAAGTTLTMVFDKVVSFAGDTTGFTITTTPARTLGTPVASGNTVTATINTAVYSGETVTFSYTAPVNGLEDSINNVDVVAITDQAVTNNSTQVPATSGKPKAPSGVTPTIVGEKASGRTVSGSTYDLNLTWTEPTQWEDDTALTPASDIDHYTIQVRHGPGVVIAETTVAQGTSGSITGVPVKHGNNRIRIYSAATADESQRTTTPSNDVITINALDTPTSAVIV